MSKMNLSFHQVREITVKQCKTPRQHWLEFTILFKDGTTEEFAAFGDDEVPILATKMTVHRREP